MGDNCGVSRLSEALLDCSNGVFTGASALTELRDRRTAGLMADLSIVNEILNFNQVVTSDIENFRLIRLSARWLARFLHMNMVHFCTTYSAYIYVYNYGAQTRSIDLVRHA